jgi:nitrogen regulatory protein PII
MRLVIAVLKPAQVESVRQSLAAAHVTRMTVADAQGYGVLPDGAIAQEAVVEVAVNEDFLARTVEAITAVLSAGGGDVQGRLFVMPMQEAVQIYRSVRGPEAV